ncbi:TolC family outer membrane protein [Pseudomonas sp.]|uniref:TolC family outer membrane protein n=1 Tax=Pseudomonas sp. TaxID=306 RepID=UPI00299D5661|nr:TolC family outer membrane protein [Pseudomonas sp.]MDX1370194.1 TolC family outer membrane protein [Pseudomonas sp.]MDX1722917.1 TolC family outer membrane protein [Pseudomonas sp.]
MRFLPLLPLALAISLSANGQTLNEAMQSALEVHPEIQAGINARLSVEEQMKAAKGGYLPQVDLLAGYGREGTDNPSTRATYGHDYKTLTRGESSLRLQQMLFDGFATSSEVGRQRATVNARAYELLGTSERTALTVAQVYLDVLKRRDMVRLAEDNLRSHERIYDQISLRSERGVGRMADLDQAEARLAQARNNLITEQTNLADAQVNYYSVIGSDPRELSMPQGLPGRLPENLQAAREEMLANNPFLSSAESDVQASEQQYEASKSTFYPRFDAELSQGVDNNIDGVPGHSNEWQAMLRMRYNLFAGGSNKADLQSKAHQVNQAMDIRNNALRVLNEDLGLAWNALENSRQQLPIAQQYVDYSSRVRDSYQKQFGLGERTLLDLLDSENELFTAARRMEEVRYTELFTQYRIKATMGSLLQSQGVVAPMAAAPLDVVKAKVTLPGLN